MMVLINSSKTMRSGPDRQSLSTADLTLPEFLSDADRLSAQLRRLTAEDIRLVMKTSDRLTEQVMDMLSRWRKSAHGRDGNPSLLAFRGDVYEPIGADDMTISQFKFAQQHLRILSGLYGILKPLDLIQAYRLEMAARLKTPAGKNLYDFWGDRIAASIGRDLQVEGSSMLINLASNEYLKAARVKQIPAQIVQPVFKEYKNGSYRVVAIYAKRARGLMTGFILKNAITDPEVLKNFDLDGYRYRPGRSTDQDWVFTRKR